MNQIFGMIRNVYFKYVFPWLYQKDMFLLQLSSAQEYESNTKKIIIGSVKKIILVIGNQDRTYCAHYIKKNYLKDASIRGIMECVEKSAELLYGRATVDNIKKLSTSISVDEEYLVDRALSNIESNYIFLLDSDEQYDVQKITDLFVEKANNYDVVTIKLGKEIIYEKMDRNSFIKRPITLRCDDLYDCIDKVCKMMICD